MTMRRVTLIAGSGSLVPHVAAAVRRHGDALQVVGVVPHDDLGSADVRLDELKVPEMVAAVRAFGSTHLALAGAVHISDANRRALAEAAGLGAQDAAPVGDLGIGQIGPSFGRAAGVELIDLDQLVPELLAPEGRIAGPEATAEQMEVARYAFGQARRAGALDLGQAVVASGRRLVATEDIGGTDLLLERVAAFRERGLIGTGSPLVLAKVSKPGQPAFFDLPAIGARTVLNAAAAGVTMIVVEAKRTLVLEQAELAASADRNLVAVVGLLPDA